MTTKQKVIDALIKQETHSAWIHGVVAYAVDMVTKLTDRAFAYLVYYSCQCGEDGVDDARALLRRPYESWRDYGKFNGKTDEAIATMLCTPKELERFDGGKIPPNGRTTWQDIQTRALYNAACLIVATVQSLQGVE